MPLEGVKKLGIIAGAGYLPKHVYTACKEQGVECVVLALEGETSFELFHGVQLEKFKVYRISKILKKMHEEGVTHVTLAGRVKRAEISRLLMDLKGAKLFAMLVAKGMSDNSLLQTVMHFIEGEGFEIIAPDEIAQDVIVHKGVLTKVKPDKQAEVDIKSGMKILTGIADYDVGQSLVIQNGLVLGVEAAEGTDELVKRCGSIKQTDEAGPILLKICKPNQDKRVDLPCIGTDTVEMAHQYGLRGIAVEADTSLILDQINAIKLANKYKIFIIGV
jgi:DUF1009 family protein